MVLGVKSAVTVVLVSHTLEVGVCQAEIFSLWARTFSGETIVECLRQ